ncbi:hypothetical protein C8Q78DRAFT_714641 [Trametes maxima]|nr:hypothetical protein C8Q78DRAFT_714641 [Trametes maxima]
MSTSIDIFVYETSVVVETFPCPRPWALGHIVLVKPPSGRDQKGYTTVVAMTQNHRMNGLLRSALSDAEVCRVFVTADFPVGRSSGSQIYRLDLCGVRSLWSFGLLFLDLTFPCAASMPRGSENIIDPRRFGGSTRCVGSTKFVAAGRDSMAFAGSIGSRRIRPSRSRCRTVCTAYRHRALALSLRADVLSEVPWYASFVRCLPFP